jgi:hypothetical protein
VEPPNHTSNRNPSPGFRPYKDEKEVCGGAQEASGGGQARLPDSPRGLDAAGLQAPAFTDVNVPVACRTTDIRVRVSRTSQASGRRGLVWAVTHALRPRRQQIRPLSPRGRRMYPVRTTTLRRQGVPLSPFPVLSLTSHPWLISLLSLQARFDASVEPARVRGRESVEVESRTDLASPISPSKRRSSGSAGPVLW